MEDHGHHHHVGDVPVAPPPDLQNPLPEVEIKPQIRGVRRIHFIHIDNIRYLIQMQTLKLANAISIKIIFVIKSPY